MERKYGTWEAIRKTRIYGSLITSKLNKIIRENITNEILIKRN